MPAAAPPIGEAVAARLLAVGERIRTRRKGLRISAVVAAEAAGMSRVTLHRIERGMPSVAVGAYMSAIAALGLELEVVSPQDPGTRNESQTPVLPRAIRLADYPQLERLAWQRQGAAEATLTPKEALNLYERNWRHVDQSAMDARERAFVNALARALAGGRLLVRA